MPFNDSTVYAFRGDWNSVGGVYGIMNSNNQLIYIGRTDDLKGRMAAHQADTAHCMHRDGPQNVWIEVIATLQARVTREAALIAEYTPICNA